MKKINLSTTMICLYLLTSCGQISDKDLIKAAYNGKTEAVEKAIDNGANINLKSQNKGISLLSYAAGAGKALTVYMLLNKGAHVNSIDNSGWNALHFAASNGHSNVINMLVDHHIDINLASADGWTPLMYASFSNHYDIVANLLENGANPSIALPNGADALAIAQAKGYVKVVATLKSH